MLSVGESRLSPKSPLESFEPAAPTEKLGITQSPVTPSTLHAFVSEASEAAVPELPLREVEFTEI